MEQNLEKSFAWVETMRMFMGDLHIHTYVYDVYIYIYTITDDYDNDIFVIYISRVTDYFRRCSSLADLLSK